MSLAVYLQGYVKETEQKIVLTLGRCRHQESRLHPATRGVRPLSRARLGPTLVGHPSISASTQQTRRVLNESQLSPVSEKTFATSLKDVNGHVFGFWKKNVKKRTYIVSQAAYSNHSGL